MLEDDKIASSRPVLAGKGVGGFAKNSLFASGGNIAARLARMCQDFMNMPDYYE